MHKHNFGQTLKIQSAVVTLNAYGQGHRNLIYSFCLQTMYQCKFGVVKFTGSEDKTQKRLICSF